MPQASLIADPRPVDLINCGIFFSQEAHASLAKHPARAADLLRHSAKRMTEAADMLEAAPCSQ